VTEDTSIRNKIYALLVAALAGSLTLTGILILQHNRHGWPFSLHHQVMEPAQPASQQAPEAHAQAHARSSVEIDPGKAAQLGLRTEPVRRESMAPILRAVATVVPDEERVSHIHTRVAGWIEELYVRTTGETVRAGQALAGIFSQDLYASQVEYLALRAGAKDMPKSAVIEGARRRLQVLGMNDAEIAGIERTGAARRLVTITAPRAGVVLRRAVSAGTAVDPSTELMTIADLSEVWVLAEASEADAARLKPGATASLSFPESGRPPFKATVDFIYPTLTERTRTVRMRLRVPNPDGSLRPGLYGTVEFSAPPRESLTVARDAVVYTGDAQHVFVQAESGVIEPRDVQIGGRVGERIEVTAGLSAGEQVVTTGVFLIDSESRLRASGGAGHAGHGSPEQRDQATDADSKPVSGQHSNHDQLDAGKMSAD
jgi:membrane fusion protein, copper/silver efflux system